MQRYASVLVLVLAASACGGSDGDSDLANQASQAEASESFAALYEDVFVPHHCVDCHGSKAPGALDMSTVDVAYEQMVGVAAAGGACVASDAMRVDPGNPAESLLIQKLQGHDASGRAVCGKPMPPEVALAAEDIDRVRSWIANGALRD